jgi:ABC-type transporter Mla subunit MlaD
LGEQREGLAGIVVNLQQTFNEEATQRKEMTAQVDQSLDRIGETVKTVNTLASAMGMTSSERLGQLQELARTIGNEAHRVEHSYQNMTEQFSEALNTGNKHLNEYLKQANETYTKSIQDADKAAAEVCTKLNETSHGLMSTAEFLVSAATELKNSNGGN